ncbi:SAM-dependent methyltransferase [Vibrio azureus]|uniref:Methyltransferase domain-containing protein n=1 Tax=Vibrio azureus NBRC 104587 TaxID=1219077 RepID=U3C2U1_9VIBR|nr:class I SAM-dependent methyltransferase [Vibrio azureus]AUI86323.1 SAM-dependent methyltransferase [Vibrio azureus]GAD75764.1 hypothetical protein VAZ01S_029_00340 [Vibrio azureus NBRC 104587]
MCHTVNFYHHNAAQLAAQYNAVTFEQVHCAWRSYWPCSGEQVLDVGAGSGRDARWFAERGCKVVAIEPAQALRKLGKEYTSACSMNRVEWLDSALPDLAALNASVYRFDLILVSAVWMHLSPDQRVLAMAKLAQLLSASGKLVISLRHGPFDDARQSFAVSVDELEQHAMNVGLGLCYVEDSEDIQGRNGVTWQKVVLEKKRAGS